MEVCTTIGHDRDGVSDIEDDQWFVHVHLEIATGPAKTHGHIVRHYLHGNHGQRLGLGWVHLAWHDR